MKLLGAFLVFVFLFGLPFLLPFLFLAAVAIGAAVIGLGLLLRGVKVR